MNSSSLFARENVGSKQIEIFVLLAGCSIAPVAGVSLEARQFGLFEVEVTVYEGGAEIFAADFPCPQAVEGLAEIFRQKLGLRLVARVGAQSGVDLMRDPVGAGVDLRAVYKYGLAAGSPTRSSGLRIQVNDEAAPGSGARIVDPKRLACDVS